MLFCNIPFPSCLNNFALVVNHIMHNGDMKIKRLFLALAIATVFSTASLAAPTFVSQTEGTSIIRDGKISIYIDPDSPKGVKLAADNLRKDLEAVCGKQTRYVKKYKDATIVISTSPSRTSGMAEQLNGKKEMFLIRSEGGKLHISGSDRRGTIYGIYELSRQAGVSPWYYWADVPVEKKSDIRILPGTYTDGEPSVEWRGIFLNDEAPCLTSWVKNTFGTEFGGHEFYEKVFELILRLKGNLLWPAMWNWAFYADDPMNSELADEMGVIISTSHHEPMARNHQEYARARDFWGPWNYSTNPQMLDRFFREGIERIKGKEDIVTIAMRGDGDEAMGEDADTALLEKVVENQRKIIEEVTGKDASQTPQVWALYKEVLDYYDKGMRVPDDVTILLSDDNWGDIRRVPREGERFRPGGWGIYYHVDYVGAPRNSKLVNVTQTISMWEQLRLAFDYGIRKMWILNVGDLKPMEYQIQFFMDMAWNPESFNQNKILSHTEEFCSHIVGKELAHEAAAIIDKGTKYSSRVTAEMLDRNTFNLQSGEWASVLSDYVTLERDALRLMTMIDREKWDSYKELILFPIQLMANLYGMYYAQAMNLALYEKGDPEADFWADEVEKAFRRDAALMQSYNKDIAGGKWNGMMTQKHIGYTSWNDDFPEDTLPEIKRVGTGPMVFTAENGTLTMDAEHFYRSTSGGNREWAIYPDFGRMRSAIALTPYTETPDGDSLEYAFTIEGDIPEEAQVHIIIRPTLDFLGTGGRFTVSLDDCTPVEVHFNRNLNEQPENIYSVYYPTVASRAVESIVTLPVEKHKDLHKIMIKPLSPGIVFEGIVVNLGGYKPQYLFGEESTKHLSDHK